MRTRWGLKLQADPFYSLPMETDEPPNVEPIATSDNPTPGELSP
jgi:hypothetical protein